MNEERSLFLLKPWLCGERRFPLPLVLNDHERLMHADYLAAVQTCWVRSIHERRSRPAVMPLRLNAREQVLLSRRRAGIHDTQRRDGCPFAHPARPVDFSRRSSRCPCA